MAASFDSLGKIWKVAAADAGSTVIDKQDLRVSSIRWVVDSGGAAGDLATITDPDGSTVLWHDTNDTGAQLSHVDNAKRRWPRGFVVPTLSKGVLYIALE